MVKKTAKIFLVAIFVFAFFLSQQSFAAGKKGGSNVGDVGGTTTGTDGIDNQIKSHLKDLNLPDMIGVNCGIPNSNIDQCCTGKTNTTPIGNQLDSLFPDFLCLPNFLAIPIKISLKLGQGAKEAIGGIGEILTAHPIGGAKDLVKGVGCIISFGFFGCDNSGDTKPLCISQIPKAFAGIVISQTPVANLVNVTGLKDAQVCVEGARQTSTDSASQSCKCVRDPLGKGALCEKYISQPTELQACLNCSGNGIWTGLGCINTSVGGFVGSLMGIGIGLAGISALLCIIYSAFILQVSQGNPERLKKAREYLTNCIVGLLVILFSVMILRLVGVTIIKIPGFI